MNNNKQFFSEIIESSLHGWLAQSWQWNVFPAFGSLVMAQDAKRTVYGIVYQVQTGSMDPMRYPFTYQMTQEQLLAEQPQIFEFLKTTFHCLTVGYVQKGKTYYLVCPEPMPIHTFVGQVSKEQLQQFFAHQNYLHILFGFASQVANMDELLLAVLRNLAHEGLLTTDKFGAFIDNYSLLTGNDYRRLKLFVQRAECLLV